MRTRLLVSVAALAATLLLPAAASAVGQPSITTPAVSPFTTRIAPVHLVWGDVPDAIGFRVFRADPDCTGNLTDLTLVPGPLDPGSTFIDDTPPATASYCYYVQALDIDGVSFENSSPVQIDFDATPPTGTLGAPLGGALLQGAANALEADNVSDVGTGVDSVVFQRFNGSIWVPIATSADTSSPYTANWDTTGLTGSSIQVRALITDVAANTFTTPIATVTVDNSDPTAAITAPAASALLHGTVNGLSATASDAGTGVSSVTFQRFNGSIWVPIATSLDTTTPYTANWDTTGLDGSVDIRVVATDGASHTFQGAPVTVTVDNTLPTGSLTSPAGGAILHGTSNALAATASNTGPGVPSVRFEYFNGSTWVLIDTDGSSPWSATWDTTGLNGSVNLRVVVTDSATNQFTSSSVAVTVDNTVPVVTLLGIANGQNVSGSLQLSATATDVGGSGVQSVQYGRRIAGSGGGYTTIGSSTTGPSYAVAFDTLSGPVPDGLYQIRALATDLATNQQESTVTNVRVDNTDPTVPGTPSGLTPVSAAPTITFSPSTDGGSGVDHYVVYRNGTPTGPTVAAAGPFTWSDTGATTAGSYTYTVAAVDVAGNASNPSLGGTIYLDPAGLSAPTSVTALATPTSQRPQFSWVAPSAFATDHYSVYRGGVLVLDNIPAGTTVFTDNTATDGSFTYQVVAKNSSNVAGIASAPVTILFDTVAPAAPGAVTATAALDGSVGIGWAAASDGAGSGIARYVVRRSLSSSAPVSAADGDATCQGLFTSCPDVTTLNGKLYSYAVFAVDAVGNTSPAGSSAAVTARDQLAPGAPKGLLATPGDASVDLRWSAAGADDDVAGYVLVAKVGSAAPASEADGTRVCTAIVAGSTACSATGLTNGATYTFGLFALDEALNRSQAAVVSAAPNGKVTDVKAPAAVTALKAKVAGTKVTLTWKNPADRDFDHVVITASERKPSARAAVKRVYSGKGTKAKTKVAAGGVRWFTVVAYDAVGNASPATTVRVKLAAPSRFGPEPRAKVRGKVRLSWPVAKGAKYYNVQVFAGKKRILVSWPAGRALQLPSAKLKRGTTYTWYVWPGLGAKAKAHYGKLIGKNSFTFAG